MTQLDDFRFSQSSLQDFSECPRRFELRYLLRLAWPAVQTEPVLEQEQFLRQGAQFHRLVQQHSLGVPAERLEQIVQAAGLETWWGNFLQVGATLSSLPALGPGELVSHHELSLGAGLAEFRLVARFDRLDLASGRARIIDWKTSRQRPPRTWLAGRLQTRLYRYLLVKGGAELNGGLPFDPAAVELVYWFAGFPEQPERFTYSAGEYAADETYLLNLLSSIQASGPGSFPLTREARRCAYCVYRSLCDRGVAAGTSQADDPLDVSLDLALIPGFDLDFEQVAEIEF